ncbi:MAG: hypothetical protein JJT89_17290, partial [Nitriliruptoraceae bacterium]|nr:hypothetical protein [Nitriliruptoraceae bacterium]
MSRTVPFTITDAGRASERVGGAEVTAPVGVVGFGPGEAQGPSSRVRYDGPLGPIELRYVQDEARTRLQGPHVGDALVDLGPPATTDPIRLRRRLAPGVSGRVGAGALTGCAPAGPPRGARAHGGG